MNGPLVTAESVAAACEAITAAGERPTVARITAHLGGGSPNKILPLLNAWKDARQQAGPMPEATAPEAAPATEIITPELTGQVDHLARGILTMLSAAIERERHQASSAQQAIQTVADQKVALARQAADQQIADLQAQAATDLAEARQEAQDQAEAAARLAEELAAVIGDRDQVTQERDGLAIQLAEAERIGRQAELDRDHQRALAERAAEEIKALRELLAEKADATAKAEGRAEKAETARDLAEQRAAHAEQARDQADAERRQAHEQARADLEKERSRSRELQERMILLEAAKAEAAALAVERAEQRDGLAAELRRLAAGELPAGKPGGKKS